MSDEFVEELNRVLAWIDRTYGSGLRQACEKEFHNLQLSGGGAERFDPYEVFEKIYTSRHRQPGAKIPQFAPSKFYGHVTIEELP